MTAIHRLRETLDTHLPAMQGAILDSDALWMLCDLMSDFRRAVKFSPNETYATARARVHKQIEAAIDEFSERKNYGILHRNMLRLYAVPTLKDAADDLLKKAIEVA